MFCCFFVVVFYCSNSKECQEWIDTINFVAASLSAPPLPGGCGSQRKFERPLLPASYTRLNLVSPLVTAGCCMMLRLRCLYVCSFFSGRSHKPFLECFELSPVHLSSWMLEA